MPTHLVNLDALIERDDFEAAGDTETGGAGTPPFTLSGLKRGEPFFNALRKPDFQRDTTNWSPKIIVEFVRSFLDNELIPSIILWQAPSNRIFIIDGAHRFSALIAWVNEDYGDGDISREFFGHNISPAQRRYDKETRQLMEQVVGSFTKLDYIARHPKQTNNPSLLRRAFATTTQPLYFQKVTGDAKTAEKSYFKINGNPAVIDTTELGVIKARLKPNAIATRALMRAGTGHRYWGKFPKAEKISELARETYELLFGEIVELGTRSPDIPRAGQPYSNEAFKMILDMVNLFNDITPAMWQESDEEDEFDKFIVGRKRKPKDTVPKLPNDTDGTETLRFLRKVKEVAQLTSDYDYRGSLGFDQAVYSYGKAGKFHTTAFIASLNFAKELQKRDQEYVFTKIREPFEEFLVRHKSFINDLGHSKGSRLKSLGSFLKMYRIIMKALQDGITHDAEIIAKLKEDSGLKIALKEDAPDPDENPPKRKFSKAVIAAAVVRDKLATRNRCTICNARLPEYVRSKEHAQDIKYGGLGTVDNLQFVHPYCNSVKTKLESEGWTYEATIAS
jgi:hypothetical protein